MALSTYAALQASVAAYLHRSDLGAVIPDFISLAEERMNRTLRVRQMETALADTAIASGAVVMPSGTVGIKALWAVGSPNRPLLVAPFDVIKGAISSGEAHYFAWQGDALYFDGSGTVGGVLYAQIPALASNSSNWLLAAYPSAYLHGALREASIYLRDEAGIAFHDIKFQEALNEIGAADMRDRYAGPLQVRAR